MAEKIYLIDGSGYIFRAFYAVAELSTRQGFPTNALFGFTRMLMSLLRQVTSDHVVMVFDAGRETFRNTLYPAYKANRSACPEPLVPQLPFFRDISTAFGLPLLEHKGFEADDIIATLVARLTKEGHEVVVVTADKDLMQLVSDHVELWDTMRDRRIKNEQVIEKFGVPPEQVVEVLALTGDDSDNIPGVDGIGPKTAAQLIQRYGTVDNLLLALDDIPLQKEIRGRDKIAAQLKSQSEQLKLSRVLVEVRYDVPLSFPQEAPGAALALHDLDSVALLQELKRRPLPREQLSALLQRFEFGTLAKELDLLPAVGAASAPTTPTHTVFAGQFAEFLEKLKSQAEFSFDVETTALAIPEAHIVGLSFCWSAAEAWYLPLGHTDSPEPMKPRSEALLALKAIFEDPKVGKVGQNLKFDVGILAQHGITVAGVSFDTMLASYVLNPDKPSHGMTALAHEFLSRRVIEYTEVTKGLSSFAEVSCQDASQYACQDALIAWELTQILRPQIESEDLHRVYYEIEVPLLLILSGIERHGVTLDLDLFQRMSAEFGTELARMEAELYALCGGAFNLNSPKQLGEVLFTRLGIATKGLKRTKTGISTDSSVLEKLSSLHPVPAKILEYRGLFKLKSTYVDALPRQISAVTGRLHTRLNQSVAATGRLSSSEPNLQNIPVQRVSGRRIRSGFIAPAGKVLISADYSQVELRVLAHLTGDANLIRTFVDNVDVHSATAREILGLPHDAPISNEQRRAGKTINFGIVYGMGAYRLSQELGIPFGEANRYIESYFERFPGVRQYFASLERDADQQGMVRTILGRRRIISAIDTSGRDRGFALRAAINAPVQGSAADIIKLAMVQLERENSHLPYSLDLILQIHDELLFECDQGALELACGHIKRVMENVLTLKVPLEVEIGSGPNWNAAQH